MVNASNRPAFVYEAGRVVFTHTCLGGDRVEAILNTADWQVMRIYPLTVEPSVGCDRCGLHGWITDGCFQGTPGEELLRDARERAQEAVEAGLRAAT